MDAVYGTFTLITLMLKVMMEEEYPNGMEGGDVIGSSSGSDPGYNDYGEEDYMSSEDNDLVGYVWATSCFGVFCYCH